MVTLPTAPFRLLRRDLRHALRFMRRWFAARGLRGVIALMGVFAVIYFLAPLDGVVIKSIADSSAAHPGLIKMAGLLSYYGDFLGFNLALLIGFQIAGWLLRSRRLLRIAVASLLCASFAGLSADVIRSVTGRPRPSSGLEDKLHGPSLSHSLQALPSAHTATAFGGALTVLTTEPVIGVPLMLVAVAVGWSRLQLNRHHLTDVLTSIVIAFIFSLPLARWVNVARDRGPRG